MNDANPEAYLGRGWSFPPRFDRGVGGVAMTTGVADVTRALELICTTRLGERLMRPHFGCALVDGVFGGTTVQELTFLKHTIETAVTRHEARVDLDDVLLTPSTSGVLTVELRYRLRGANSRFNHVFPFYLAEADTQP